MSFSIIILQLHSLRCNIYSLLGFSIENPLRGITWKCARLHAITWVHGLQLHGFMGCNCVKFTCIGNSVHTGCPTKHDSWWIFLNVFFHNFLSCLIPKRIIIKIYWSKRFSNELNCKKSLNLIQYLENDILNYSSIVMFRGTPCTW